MLFHVIELFRYMLHIGCSFDYLYIFIPVIIPVRRWSLWDGLGCFGVGWGGVGMMTFLAHEHIVDATENWGGVGWGGDDDVPCA